MKIPIGLDKTSNVIKLISEVERGLKCNCICPECKSLLIAKKGPEKADHFAHHRSKEGQACRETALHLMAKYVLVRQSEALLPLHKVLSDKRLSLLREPFVEEHKYFTSPQDIFDVREEVVMPEVGIKPDILCNIEVLGNTYELAIEVAVTHEVDSVKLKKIEAADLSTIEIDLSDLVYQDSITFNDIYGALDEGFRLAWLHICSRLKRALKVHLDRENNRKLAVRNAEITAWHQDLKLQLEQQTQISLPLYNFESYAGEIYVVDMSNRNHKIGTPSLPSIGGRYMLSSVGNIESGVITLRIQANNSEHELDVVLVVAQSLPKIPKGSYLCIHGEQLPPTKRFEQSLTWGKSVLAERYIKRIDELRKKKLDQENRKIKVEIHRKLKRLEAIRSGSEAPTFYNIDRIERDYWAARTELEDKGFNTSQVTTNIVDGWVFGCPNEYWQTILFRSICWIDNASVTVSAYNQNLEKHHNIKAIEPARSLSYLKSAIEDLGRDVAIPTAYGVLSEYFWFLSRQGFLRKAGRGQFRKSAPYGKAYRTLIKLP